MSKLKEEIDMTASLVLVFLAVVKRMPLPRWRDVPGFALTAIVGIALYIVMILTSFAIINEVVGLLHLARRFSCIFPPADNPLAFSPGYRIIMLYCA